MDIVDAMRREQLIESPARIRHRLLNEGRSAFRCLVGQTPRPSESTRPL